MLDITPMDSAQFQELKNLLVQARTNEPFSALVREIKNDQKELNRRIHEHLDNEEKSHNEFMDEIKGIKTVIQATPLVNKTVLGAIGLIVVAAIGGFIGFSWKFISSIIKP